MFVLSIQRLLLEGSEMKKIKEILKTLSATFDPIFELTIYITIAFTISELLDVSFINAITIVFVYFLLSIIRDIIKVMRDKVT